MSSDTGRNPFRENATLRQMAESTLHATPSQSQHVNGQYVQELAEALETQDENLTRLLHELHVHQVELETQNEELRQVRQELTRSRDTYADLYDFAPVGYFTIDHSMGIVEANLTGALLLGIERDRLMSQPLTRFMVPEDQDVFYLHRAQLDGQHKSQTCEVRLQRSDGSLLPVQLESKLFQQPDGTPYYRIVLIDISARVEAEEARRRTYEELEQRVHERTAELQQANDTLQAEINERIQAEAAERRARIEAEKALQMRDQVFRLVSHDLRTPLTSVRGYTQLLQRQVARLDIPEAAQLATGLGGIDEAASRLIDQVQELLDVAAAQAGRALSLRWEALDLVALLRRVIAESQQTTREHTICAHIEADYLHGAGDELRLDRVLHNLLTNAIKYSPQGGEIVVRAWQQTEEHQPWAVISVQDQGIGIPAEDLPFIFEAFTRASNTPEQIDGTGLGLASARQIIEQHGGSIGVASQPGQGTTFTIRLPLNRPEA
jgi:PAS domain S-box-containing protein